MIKKVYQKFLKNFNVTIKFSALLSLILIVIYLFMALILTYMPTIFSDFLGLVLLLLILYFLVNFLSPFFYSFFANNMALETKDSSQVNIMSFIGTRRIGKRRGIKNIQQLFKWLLYSYLIYLVLEFIMADIYACKVEPVDGAPALGTPGDYTKPQKYLVTNTTFRPDGVPEYSRLYEIQVHLLDE